MKILFLSQLLPLPLDAGPKVRAFYVLRYLAETGHRVTLVSFVRETDNPASRELEFLSELCDSVVTVPLRRSLFRNLRDGLLSLVSNEPFLIRRDRSKEMLGTVAQLTRDFCFDAVHADQLWMAPFAAGLDTGMLKVLDQHNAVFEVARRWAQLRPDPLTRKLVALEASKLEGFEYRLCRSFDHVVWVSSRDRRVVGSSGGAGTGKSKEHVIPIATDPLEHPTVQTAERTFRVTFLGGMHWPPNSDGIRWFAEKIWPRIAAEVPYAQLTVIGKDPPAALGRLGERCTVTGFARELTPLLAETRVFIVPLRSGAGMRVKILDAWCWGIPVVSTSLGAEGLKLESGKNLLLSDSVESFASAVVRLFQHHSLARRLTEGGKQTIADHYDWRRVYRLWDRIYG